MHRQPHVGALCSRLLKPHHHQTILLGVLFILKIFHTGVGGVMPVAWVNFVINITTISQTGDMYTIVEGPLKRLYRFSQPEIIFNMYVQTPIPCFNIDLLIQKVTRNLHKT